MHNILLTIEVLTSIMLLITIMLQPSKTDTSKLFISQASETYYISNNKNKTKEATLIKLTWILFFIWISTIVLINFI